MEYLSSIVFQTVIMKCFQEGQNQDMRLHFYIVDKIGVSIIDSIPHCHTEMLLKGTKIKKCGFLSNIEYKIGVPIIDSIPHCQTENDLKRGKNQEMWLRFYIENKIGVSIIDSIPPCNT